MSQGLLMLSVADTRPLRKTMRVRHLATGLAIAGVATSSLGYQTDFHYGVTYWLGLQSGLKPEESAYLASGDEWKDAGMLDARTVVAYNICFKKEPDAFKLMRENHFRASTQYPAPPADRAVTPASAFGEEEVREMIAKVPALPIGSPQALDRLLDFGGALHGYQDTFSHQGVSQVPWLCDQNIAWTHPKARNGETSLAPNWLGTGADQTYKWQPDCMEAVKGTYGHLLAFLAKLYPGRTRPKDWDSQVAKEARAFCAAETKSAKVDWFVAHNVPQEQAILASSTLKDGAPSFHYRLRVALNLKPSVPVTELSEQARRIDAQVNKLAANVDKPDVSPQVRSVLERYLRALVRAPAASLPEQLGPMLGYSGSAPLDHPVLINTQRLRFVDRGLATDVPIPLAQLATPDADIGTVAEGVAASWQSFLVTPRGQSSEQPYILGSASGRMYAFVLLRHAPYEVLAIELKGDSKSAVIANVTVLDLH